MSTTNIAIAGTIAMINIADIVVQNVRLRARQQGVVAALAKSIAKVGQLHAITVRACGPHGCGAYELIAGVHRFEAAKTLGWTTIAAVVVAVDGTSEAELLGIDENLRRAELTPAERAQHIGRAKELYEKLHPETKAGAAGKGRSKLRQIGEAKGRFSRDTSEKTGQSERAVQRDATRAKQCVVLADIAGTCLDKGAEIDALAKLPATAQRKLAARAKAGEAVSAKDTAKKAETRAAGAVARALGRTKQSPAAAAIEEAQVRAVEQCADFSMPADIPTQAPAPAKLDP